MKDDVDHATKQLRLAEVIEVFREKVQQRNVKSEKGKLRVVLVEFDSRRSTKDVGESKERQLVAGRNAAAAGLVTAVRSGRNDVSGIVLFVFLLIVLLLIVFVRSWVVGCVKICHRDGTRSFFLLLQGDRRKGALRPPPEARRGANGDREARRRRGPRVHLGHGLPVQRGVGEAMR